MWGSLTIISCSFSQIGNQLNGEKFENNRMRAREKLQVLSGVLDMISMIASSIIAARLMSFVLQGKK